MTEVGVKTTFARVRYPQQTPGRPAAHLPFRWRDPCSSRYITYTSFLLLSMCVDPLEFCCFSHRLLPSAGSPVARTGGNCPCRYLYRHSISRSMLGRRWRLRLRVFFSLFPYFFFDVFNPPLPRLLHRLWSSRYGHPSPATVSSFFRTPKSFFPMLSTARFSCLELAQSFLLFRAPNPRRPSVS